VLFVFCLVFLPFLSLLHPRTLPFSLSLSLSDTRTLLSATDSNNPVAARRDSTQTNPRSLLVSSSRSSLCFLSCFSPFSLALTPAHSFFSSSSSFSLSLFLSQTRTLFPSVCDSNNNNNNNNNHVATSNSTKNPRFYLVSSSRSSLFFFCLVFRPFISLLHPHTLPFSLPLPLSQTRTFCLPQTTKTTTTTTTTTETTIPKILGPCCNEQRHQEPSVLPGKQLAAVFFFFLSCFSPFSLSHSFATFLPSVSFSLYRHRPSQQTDRGSSKRNERMRVACLGCWRGRKDTLLAPGGKLRLGRGPLLLKLGVDHAYNDSIGPTSSSSLAVSSR